MTTWDKLKDTKPKLNVEKAIRDIKTILKRPHKVYGHGVVSIKEMEKVSKDLLDQFNIIKSRVRTISDDKQNVLWLHDLAADPENNHLKDAEARKRFEDLCQ